MKLRVLLVEDNALNQELARDLLDAAGHHVDVVGDADRMRAQIAAGNVPDIVIMDILLPGIDGVALLAELRESSRLARVPIIAVTAQALTGDRQRFLAAGFDGVLTKPIDTRTFVAAIERCAHDRHVAG